MAGEAFLAGIEKLAQRTRDGAASAGRGGKKPPTKKELRRLIGARHAAAALGTGAGIATLWRERGIKPTEAELAATADRLRAHLPHAKTTTVKPWSTRDSSSPHFNIGENLVHANSPEVVSHEMAHADLWNRLDKSKVPLALVRSFGPAVGGGVGAYLVQTRDPHSAAAKRHWIPSLVGSLPMLADETQANVRGYLAARKAGLSPKLGPYLGSMASYLVAAGAPIMVNEHLRKTRLRIAEEKAKRERSSTKTASMRPWLRRAEMVGRAMRESSDPDFNVLHPEFVRRTMRGHWSGLGIGAATGAAAAGLPVGLISYGRGRPSPGRDAGVAAAHGAIVGGLVGQHVGERRGLEAWLRERGIEPKWHGLDWEFSPEAKKRFGDRRATADSYRAPQEKTAEAPTAAVKERGPSFGIDLARLERHANEHRLMALLGIDHRGRPLVGGGS